MNAPFVRRPNDLLVRARLQTGPVFSGPAAGSGRGPEPVTSAASASLPLQALLASLNSAQTGLSGAEAARRLAAYGPNLIATHGPTGLLVAFLGRFRNPLVLILIAAAGVSALTGDVPSFVIITLIVLMSVVLDVVQEHRAENAAEALRKQVSLTAQVFRDGIRRRCLRLTSCRAMSFCYRPAI